MSNSRAVLTGTFNKPIIQLHFHPSEVHATATDKTLREWVETYINGTQKGQAWWRGRGGYWEVIATGPDPDRKLRLAGFELDFSEATDPSLANVIGLNELTDPLTRLSADGSSALVLPRFTGFERTKDLLGSGARWDREHKRFAMPVSDAMYRGAPREGINWDPRILDASRLSLGRIITAPELAMATAAAGAAKDILEMDQDDVQKLIDAVGDVPPWFGLDLFPFQRIGSIGVAAGHFGLFDHPGLGKANPVSEPILTPSGWTTMGQIQTGDNVIGSDGRATEVTGVFPQGPKEIARVTFTDGTFSLCTWDHLWSVTTPNDRKVKNGGRVLTTRQLLDQGLMTDTKRRWQIPMVAPVHFAPVAELPLDPYIVGALLGDGYLGRHNAVITTDDEIVESLNLPEGVSTVHLSTIAPGVSDYRFNGLNQIMRDLGMVGHRSETKSVPAAYLYGTPADRIALVQGLLDTDGSPVGSRGGLTSTVEYGTVSRQLAADMKHLVESLGGTVSIAEKSPKYEYRGEVRIGQLYYRMTVSLPSGIEPFRLARKADRWIPRTKYEPSRRITSIEFSHIEEAQCIKVAADDELYVTRNFIVTHNTRQAIAAASIRKSERTLITCLPVGLTGWKNEVEQSLLHTLGGLYPDGEIVVIRADKKEPLTLPERGVIITSDSLLTSRKALRQRVMAWRPEVFIYDEAHRGKTFESARSQAMLQVASSTLKMPIAVTGTPLFANPAELAPLLEFTGHLGPVFDGLDAYLNRYCKKDHFGNWKVRKEHLPELRAKLSQNVWVRRRKREVLPDLPATLRVPKYVDVSLVQYRKAYKDVIDKLTGWIKEYRVRNEGQDPDEDTIKDFALAQVGLVSLLRRAAGVAKIPAIVDDIRAHVEDTAEIVNGKPFYPRPLIVWTHHRDVSDAMAEALPAAVAETGVIRGGVSYDERDRLVKAFQANQVPVLVCSIAAAGVAITLTASSDMFFAESDWTPAAIRQAMDRAERIGQTADKIIATTYLAEGTLDKRIQQVLKEKAKILDAVYGDDNDVSVFDTESSDVESSTQIVVGLINNILAGEKPVA